MWRAIRFPGARRADPGAGKIAELERENARLLENLYAFQQRFNGMARAVWRVEENERRRLARELHDNLGQVLTALRLQLERMAEGSERDAAINAAAQALEDVRNLSRLLRPPILDDLGLMPALNWLARRIREDAGLPVTVTGDIDVKLDDDTETLLFRIAQEALTNAVKHAEATRAEISVQRAADRLEMRIRDNGRGFDTATLGSEETPTGVGLAGMKDRVAIFGGQFVINSAPGKGVTVSAVLTLPQITESK